MKLDDNSNVTRSAFQSVECLIWQMNAKDVRSTRDGVTLMLSSSVSLDP